MIFELFRDGQASPNYGELFADGRLLGQTLEDEDRHLEVGGTKIPKQTAIPRGRFRLRLSYSNRFKKIMPEILDVPSFTGIRIHGGNDEVDTDGCLLLGTVRTPTGIADCHGPNERLMAMLRTAQVRDEECWIEIK